ncbi:hypothetical protein NP493_546g03097 [Ridgeia piscesae]|uniref:G-protein coupled receptors family 1 profile domain-containing protein n=1 Tax=Ridgeia piscesae TaxID=27915 RepID=A0AAD9KVF0_RIDPI|nr:hypothetical protein NP493_546g03097 [Ridgeia piscesae]
MDSLITPSVSGQVFNESVQRHVSNDSTIDHVNDHIIRVPIENVAVSLVCVLGIPGNILVIAVYSWNMATSTRVYMLALAIADLQVCLIGVFLTTVKFTIISLEITVFFVHTSVIFSALLLSFVSMERLLAMRRPHSFSLSPRRAKVALVVIAVMAAICSMVLTVGRINSYNLLIHVFTPFVTMTSVVVMIGCYSIMAMTMLMRAAHRNVVVARVTPLPGPSSDHKRTFELANVAPQSALTSNKICPQSVAKATTAKQAKVYKSVSLLFIISIVFLACWIPQWLFDIGVHIKSYLKGMFVLNSVVNPFIYSAVSAMFHHDVRQFCRQTRVKLSSCCRQNTQIR